MGVQDPESDCRWETWGGSLEGGLIGQMAALKAANSELQSQVDEMKRLICEVLDSNILSYDCPWNVSAQVYHDCLEATGRPHVISECLWEDFGEVVDHKYQWGVITKQMSDVQDDLSLVAKSWETGFWTAPDTDHQYLISTSLADAWKFHAEAITKCKAAAKEDARHE